MNRPLSLNRWMYVEGNPVINTDSSGHIPLRLGYIEGQSLGGGLGNGDIAGAEIVYDYATMTRARFTYHGEVGGILGSWGGTIYVGYLNGFHYDSDKRSTLIKKDYEGSSIGGYGDICIACIHIFGGLSSGGGIFHNPDYSIKGSFLFLSLGVGPLPGEGVTFVSNYTIGGTIEYYADKDGYVDRGRLISDILSGSRSPALGIVSSVASLFSGARNSQISLALIAAERYEDFHVRNPYTCPMPYGPPNPIETPPSTPPSILPMPDPFKFPVPWNTP